MKKVSVILPLIFLMFICCTEKIKLNEESLDSVTPTNSLPASWRAFSDVSPWNTPIPLNAPIHPRSDEIISKMSTSKSNIRFANTYLPPLWVVDYDRITHLPVKSKYPFDIWDTDNDFIVDIKIPITSDMWGEQTNDGHIIIIDTNYNYAWEMSRFKGVVNDTVKCSTFNVWDLTGTGVGNPNEGQRWRQRGGRGSGFPIIAGLIRPEEVTAGEIRHALTFTFDQVKQNDYFLPGCRTDGFVSDIDAPAEGMLFRLNPNITETDFERMGLSKGAIVVARALQKYGMYLCDSGGDMALQIQLLDKNMKANRRKWDSISPGLYSSIQRIPTNQFKLIYTGEPLSGGAQNVVTTPLIEPMCGTFSNSVDVKISVHKHWPNAQIRYTTDGSIPTKLSTLYIDAFKITTNTTILAKAFDENGKDSPIMRASINIVH